MRGRWPRNEATVVDRAGKKITDVGAQALASLCFKLTSIGLNNTQVTDAGVQALANSCPNLAEIHLSGTQVTAAAKRQLEAKLPQLTIHVRGEVED